MLVKKIRNIYFTLTLGNTLAASFIWGINTLFLLDAGLTNLEAFAANAFFTAGMVIFEIPTGIVADLWGRKTSYMLGTLTLSASTLLYYFMWQMHAGFWLWAVASMLLGLGFTFFSGAVEAWLVDALAFAKYQGSLETIFGRAQIITGVAMLVGTVLGGVIAQFTNLGVPYILRVVVLAAMFVVSWLLMKDWGFTPNRKQTVTQQVTTIYKSSLKYGLGNPAVRWVMLAAPFTGGVGIFAFYALQPYLLQLYGNSSAYSIAGLAAAILAGSQIIGGYSAPYVRRLFSKRTTTLIVGTILSSAALLLLGFINAFIVALLLVIIWGIAFAALIPVRQTYINKMIPSEQRATVLSFDSLTQSFGGVVIQPVLGKTADIWNYSTSYIIGSAINLLAVPFLFLSKNKKPDADIIEPES